MAPLKVYSGMRRQNAVPSLASPRQQICNVHTELATLPGTQAAGDLGTVRHKGHNTI